ncbi:MAG: MFS transporter [Melioribacteraceae bacterium]|nr:MFS transporter [Melioribacteraceae bacterium]
MKMKYITRTVWVLSVISLFTDMASEMLYPIMPIYLKSIGFTIFLIGILEGAAEATAGLSKGYFGKLSDSLERRAPFVQLGYSLSAISKPMMAIFIHPIGIFFARTMDRFGKGIRTGARDAILSDEATPETKGKIFGFHRSMDTLGAVIGPLFALIYLYYYPENYKTLFLIAFLPGLLAILSSFLIKDKKESREELTTPDYPARISDYHTDASNDPPEGSDQLQKNIDSGTTESDTAIERKKIPSLFSFLKYWKTSPTLYKKIVAGLLAFTLVNSSDLFLLLRIKDAGLNDTAVIGVYIFYNLIYALVSFPLGILADKIGLKKVLVGGLIIFAVVYFGMSINSSIYYYLFLFLLYGIYAAATEGISKAWISNITDKKDTATAIGTFTAFQSIFTMIASSLAGYIWYEFGAQVLFISTAIAVLFVVIYFLFNVNTPEILKE